MIFSPTYMVGFSHCMAGDIFSLAKFKFCGKRRAYYYVLKGYLISDLFAPQVTKLLMTDDIKDFLFFFFSSIYISISVDNYLLNFFSI